MVTGIVKVVFFLLVTLFITSLALAYASSREPGQGRGEGAGKISGYAVSAVHYRLDEADPARISAVEFRLDRPAAEVGVSLDAGEKRLFPCLPASENRWECRLDGVGLSQVSSLRVIAVER